MSYATSAAHRILARFQVELEDTRQRLGFPGIAAAIVHERRILFTHASGSANLGQQHPVTPDTIFRIGSVTKLFTVVMLMQLYDRSRLQLDDPVAGYLPLPDNMQQITFRQLAAHTSGLPREAPLDYFETMVFPDGEQIISSLDEVTLIGAPGARYSYSNLGYAVLARSLKKVAAQPYEAYVHEHILFPLDMKESGFNLTKEHRPLAAVGYASVAPPQPAGDQELDIGGFAAAGQMYASLADLSYFLVWWFDDANQAVLSAARRREMLRPFSVDADAREQTALGWEVRRVGSWTIARKDGRTFGFGAGVSLIPKAKIGVIVLANSGADPTPLIHLGEHALVQLAPLMVGE